MESFELQLHPIRLQIERKVGRKLMQYVFPHRQTDDLHDPKSSAASSLARSGKSGKTPASADFLKNSSGETSRASIESNDGEPRTGLYLLPVRSVSAHDLTEDVGQVSKPTLRRSRSSNALKALGKSKDHNASRTDLLAKKLTDKAADKDDELDATVMRQRASQNRTFVSINVARCVISHSVE